MRLVACGSCSLLVRPADPRCPHCGAVRDTVTATVPSLVLLGLALAGCPADDYREDLPQDTTETTAPTSSMSASSTTVDTTDSSGTSTTESTSFSDEAAYGLPETDSFTETSTGSTGTETGTESTGTDDGTTTGTDGSGTDSSTTG
jgi:hypothetical protein